MKTSARVLWTESRWRAT